MVFWGGCLSLLLLQGLQSAVSGHTLSVQEKIKRENMDILLGELLLYVFYNKMVVVRA